MIVDYAVEYGAAPDGSQLALPWSESRGHVPGRSPPTAATARPPSSMTCTA